MKRIISLGGNFFQMTAVKAAKKLGIYVIDVDYLPDNPAHVYSDKYYNVSTTDKEAVLEIARRENIDGIISYASDVSSPTAAYVAEKLHLPTNGEKIIQVMTQKDLFKNFLDEHGFWVPKSSRITSVEQLQVFYTKMRKDIIIKPLDASGSKGVIKITDFSEVQDAFKKSMQYSRSGVLIAEEFIIRKGYQFDFDFFVCNGEIICFPVGDQHCDLDSNPYVPVGISFPSTINKNQKKKLFDEAQRAVTALGFMNGAINFEAIFNNKGEIYILEMGPRTGGNLIPDAILYSSGVDIAQMAIKSALGEKVERPELIFKDRCISSYVFHTIKSGVFNALYIDEYLSKRIIQFDMFVKKGENVFFYENSSFGIGVALLEFEDLEEMTSTLDHINIHYEVELID